MDERQQMFDLIKQHDIKMENGQAFPSNTGVDKLKAALVAAGVDLSEQDASDQSDSPSEPNPAIVALEERVKALEAIVEELIDFAQTGATPSPPGPPPRSRSPSVPLSSRSL